ncbi:hypothetical protein ACP70R_000874 [Stipagrostis hirtigluma subsp. patula]
MQRQRGIGCSGGCRRLGGSSGDAYVVRGSGGEEWGSAAGIRGGRGGGTEASVPALAAGGGCPSRCAARGRRALRLYAAGNIPMVVGRGSTVAAFGRGGS